jgi:uncharacterized protein (TIGR00369 family)
MEKVPFREADWAQKIQYMNEYDNFARLYGIRLVEYATGFARLRMEVQAIHLNSQGRIHGGWSSAMLIIGGGKAARSYGREVQITELTMNYYRGVESGVVLEIIANEKHRDAKFASYEVETRSEDGKLVVAGVVTFRILDRDVAYHLLPAPTAERELAHPLPIRSEKRVGLHEEVAGLRPCFKDSDWQAKLEYMNENENFYYSENLEVTEYGLGYCRAKLAPLQPRHFDAEGRLEPAWVAALMDPLIGKPSLSHGEFSVTAQMSISFFDLDVKGGIYGEGRERTRGEHFGVCDGDIWDEDGKLIASAACTMYLRHSEINFPREYPLNYPNGVCKTE